MRKKKTDVLQIVSVFQNKVLNKKPSARKMYQEIRMMKFKIKPVNGDISLLNLENSNFIEALWSLGKLDEFFQNHIEKLPTDQRELFLRLLDEMYEKFQTDLNAIDLKKDSFSAANGFEMEIYKERTSKAN